MPSCRAGETQAHTHTHTYNHHLSPSIALCGGSVKNATVGRVLSPSPRLGPDATQDRSCSWSMEAPTAQRLHLHLERLALGPTERSEREGMCLIFECVNYNCAVINFGNGSNLQVVNRSAYPNNLGPIKCSNEISPSRLVLWSGLDAGAVVLFDSGRGGPIPFEGVISEGPAVRVQFITDQPNHNTGFNIRYEGKSTHTYTHMYKHSIS